jgi:hypothetical protein
MRNSLQLGERKGYLTVMTKLFDEAVEAVRALPPDTQDDIARILLQLAGNDAGPVPLSAAEREAIAGSRAAAARGELATDEQVRTTWEKHGL